MPSLSIHRNDQVKVLTGSDRGKTQRVLRVFPDKGTALVEHVRVVKKTVSSKTSRVRTQGGIADQESPIDISNLVLVCSVVRRGKGRLQDAGRYAAAGLQEVRAGAAHEKIGVRFQVSGIRIRAGGKHARITES